jgi:hypothetical protein
MICSLEVIAAAYVVVGMDQWQSAHSSSREREKKGKKKTAMTSIRFWFKVVMFLY